MAGTTRSTTPADFVTESGGLHQVARVAVTAPNDPDAEAELAAASSFEALFRAEFAYVYGTLRRLSVAARDLEDVTHDVFVQVYRRFDTYEPLRPVRPWLFAFAVRVATDYRRLARHRYERQVETEPVDSAPSPADAVAKAEVLAHAFEALNAIELDRRAVFILHELDGFVMTEVAAALGISVNTGYSRLRLARAEFRRAARRLRLRLGEP